MKLRNRTVKNLVILVLVAVLLVPMIPVAKAEAAYQNIDFSQAVLASRINQKVSGDCAVVSMATIESYMHGATTAADKETVYRAVLEENGDDNYAYWGNVGYLQYDYVDWDAIYQRLTLGVPSIIHRAKGSNVQHWSVVAGYSGSEEELEWEKFIVVDVYLGTGMKDIKTAETWSYGCKIDAMALRGSGMNISIYPKTLQDWGADFYASISRKDLPGELLGASGEEGVNQLTTGAADGSDLQRWHFVRQSDGGYLIENVHSGQVLSIYEERSADGTPLCLEKKDDPDYQHWFLYKTDVGYMLQSRGTGKAVTLYPAETAQAAQLHTYSQSAAQNLNIHVHSYTTTEVDAACDQRAYTLYQCDGCADSYCVESSQAAPGHQWQLQGVKEADCSHTPMSLYLCEDCQQTKEIYEEKTFVDWTEEKPENVAEENLEVKIRYRFRDRFSTWEVEEKQLLYVKQWPAEFDTTSDLYTQYNNTPVEKSESDTMKVDPVLDEQVGYLYYHWHGPTGFANQKSEEFPDFHAFYSVRNATETDATGAYYCGGIPECPSCTYAIWYYRIPVHQQTYVVHKKAVDTDQWTEWSAWSETEVTATDDRQVETKTLYRYATNLGNHVYTDSQDKTCEVCGKEREVEERIETTPMYRLYNPNTGEHFYTGSKEERNNLTDAGWVYEGVAWNAPTKSGAPVYRLFNPNNGDHHYTMSEAERDMLVGVGWIYEGVAWNSASPSNLPLYRLFNPNADCGSHHYTGSEEERDYLVSLGWQFEGIGWYGMLK